MRIKRLELKNFRGFGEVTVDFPEDNVVVFFGENGTGKTTLLDAIAKLLSWQINEEWAPAYRITHFEFNAEDVKVDAGSANIKFSFINNNTTRIDSLALSFDEPKSGIFGISQLGPSKGMPLYPQIEKAIDANENIPVLIYYKTNREIQLSNKGVDDESFVFQNRIQSYRNAFTASIDNFRDFEEWFRYQEDFENQEKIARKDLEFVSLHLDVVRKSVTNFLKPLSNISGVLKVKRINYVESTLRKFSLTTTKNNQELRLSQLSSGERALILLVADIARRAAIANPQMPDPLQSEGIVLIDEIELHLHPKWQRTVIPALRATFPNIQFIIATHSPQVLSNVENGSVFEIENFQIFPRNTYGRDNQWILEAVMDDEARPREIQDKLDQYFALIRKGELEEAALIRTALEELIGTDEPEFAKADILIRRKERHVAP